MLRRIGVAHVVVLEDGLQALAYLQEASRRYDAASASPPPPLPPIPPSLPHSTLNDGPAPVAVDTDFGIDVGDARRVAALSSAAVDEGDHAVATLQGSLRALVTPIARRSPIRRGSCGSFDGGGGGAGSPDIDDGAAHTSGSVSGQVPWTMATASPPAVGRSLAVPSESATADSGLHGGDGHGRGPFTPSTASIVLASKHDATPTPATAAVATAAVATAVAAAAVCSDGAVTDATVASAVGVSATETLSTATDLGSGAVASTDGAGIPEPLEVIVPSSTSSWPREPHLGPAVIVSTPANKDTSAAAVTTPASGAVAAVTSPPPRHPFVRTAVDGSDPSPGAPPSSFTVVSLAEAEAGYYQPSVVLMDISMPGMSGVDVIRAVPPSFLRHCRCIAMTGSVDTDAIAVYASCGFFKVLAKPFNLAQLQEALLAAVE